MILKKINNNFVLEGISTYDVLNTKMFHTVENAINLSFIDNSGFFYVKDILELFKIYDKDFSFEIDDSISDDDRIIWSFVEFICYREEDDISISDEERVGRLVESLFYSKKGFPNDEQRYKIVFRMIPKGGC